MLTQQKYALGAQFLEEKNKPAETQELNGRKRIMVAK